MTRSTHTRRSRSRCRCSPHGARTRRGTTITTPASTAARKGNWSVVVAEDDRRDQRQRRRRTTRRARTAMDLHQLSPVLLPRRRQPEPRQLRAGHRRPRADQRPGSGEPRLDRRRCWSARRRQLAAASEPEPEPVRVRDPVRPAPTHVVPRRSDAAPCRRSIPRCASAPRPRSTAAKQKLAGSADSAAPPARRSTRRPCRSITDATTRIAQRAQSNDDLNADHRAWRRTRAISPIWPCRRTRRRRRRRDDHAVADRAEAGRRDDAGHRRARRRRAAARWSTTSPASSKTRRDASRASRSKMPNNGWICAFLGASQYSHLRVRGGRELSQSGARLVPARRSSCARGTAACRRSTSRSASATRSAKTAS